ncbi:ABC transporter substrate-binding protein [Natronolimnohabitans sp. A-GB9]|uniref:ABC transporter substrate-binding protein n=1 Tax=Natronolimnohabitans sp. A-GB9 TaxID=3069757 RepID=UPI0027AEB5D9|nr:ABC transporter substrate-binding protein [Natronolimnohabitans sp. A-GB9]MDQ2049853.1 ABC transporter substrate-binding protein [Natronolimnohabitans sp. A-GB9]
MAERGDRDTGGLPRRSVLAGLGVAGITGTAGCISADDVAVDGDAEELIADGFREEGVEPPVEATIYANSESDERVEWAQLVAHELNATGLFDVGFESLELRSYIDLVDNMAENEANALICFGFIGGWDPHAYVYSAFHSDSATPNGHNITHYENETVDRLIDEGVETVDSHERVEIYEKLQERLVEDAPLSFVRAHEENVVYRADVVDGFRAYPVSGGEYTSLYAPTLGVYTELRTDADELVGDVGAGISSYDPTAIDDDVSRIVTGPIYEGLLEVDFDGRIRPLLATDWEQLDETTWRFELREDVRFHTGEPFTAADVQATLERYEDTPRERAVFEWYDDVEIRDGHELDLHLRRPYGPLETTLGQLPIVPESVADGEYDLSNRPIGTGPYVFDEHDEDQYWRMKANPDHWHDGSGGVPETPPIETVTFRIVTEPSARHGAIARGDVHLSTALSGESVAAFASDDEYVVDRTTGAAVDFLGYPIYREPFTNPKVRRGISRLIPRERIVEDVFHGAGRVAYTPISPLHDEFVSPAFESELVDEYFS